MQFIINCDIEALVSLLQKDKGLSLLDAFDRVYNSDTYQKIINRNTSLYLQSPYYIYDYLKSEATN